MWQTDWVTMLRYTIGDTSATPTYSDATLVTMLAIAASYVINEVYMVTTYTVDVDNETISPDPSADNDFTTLVVLKAACLLDQGKLISVARSSGVSIKIDRSSVETDSGKLQAYKDIIDMSACKLYEDAVVAYAFGNVLAYRAIMSPAVGPNIPSEVNVDSRKLDSNGYR